MLIAVYVKGGDIKGHIISFDDLERAEVSEIAEKIGEVTGQYGVSISNLDVVGLVPKMIRGVFGCQHGCPGDAKGVASAGHSHFNLEYVEGGILSATAKDQSFSINVFPEF